MCLPCLVPRGSIEGDPCLRIGVLCSDTNGNDTINRINICEKPPPFRERLFPERKKGHVGDSGGVISNGAKVKAPDTKNRGKGVKGQWEKSNRYYITSKFLLYDLAVFLL